jgi:hypothetical protein
MSEPIYTPMRGGPAKPAMVATPTLVVAPVEPAPVEPTPAPKPKAELTQELFNSKLAEERRKTEARLGREIEAKQKLVDEANGRLSAALKAQEELTARAESEAAARKELTGRYHATLLHHTISKTELVPDEPTHQFLIHSLDARVENDVATVTIPPSMINAVAKPDPNTGQLPPPVTQPKVMPLVEAQDILRQNVPQLFRAKLVGGAGAHNGGGVVERPVNPAHLSGEQFARYYARADGKPGPDVGRYLADKKAGRIK